MEKYARENNCSEMIIGTEIGLISRLRKDNPDKEFILPSQKLICPNMKLITLEDVLQSLKEMKNIVTVPEDIRKKSLVALNKMLKVPRD